MFDVIFLAPAHFRRGEIFERIGNKAAAAEEYGRFIALWRDADQELQPLGAQARARIAKLSAAKRS